MPLWQAFEGFLLGDEYQKNILPLRKDAAVYNLTGFNLASTE